MKARKGISIVGGVGGVLGRSGKLAMNDETEDVMTIYAQFIESGK